MSSDASLITYLEAANALIQRLVTLCAKDPGDLRTVASTNLPQAIAEVLAEGLVHHLQAQAVQVWYYYSADSSYYLVARAGHHHPELTRSARLSAQDPAVAEIMGTKTPHIVNSDFTCDPWIQSPEWMKQVELQSFLAWPITLGTNPVGILTLYRSDSLEFEYLEVLKFIMSYTASAVVNARQTTQLRYQANRDGLIRQVSQQLRHSLDGETMIQTLVEQVGRVLDADCCDFLQLEWPLLSSVTDQSTASMPSKPTSLEIKPKSVIRYQKTELKSTALRRQEKDPLSVYTSIFEHPELRLKLANCEGLTIPAVAELDSQVAAQGYGALLLVPLLLQHQYQEEVLGFLALIYRNPHPFQAFEVEWTQAIASQAALALNNAQLFERTRRQGEREALLNRVTNTVHQSLRWDLIVSTAVDSLRGTLDLSRCCFFSIVSQSPHLNALAPPELRSIQSTYESKLAHLDPIAGTYSLADFNLPKQTPNLNLVVTLPPSDQDPCLTESDQLAMMRQLKMQTGILIPVYPDRSHHYEFQKHLTAACTSCDASAEIKGDDGSDSGPLIGLVGAFKETPHVWRAEEVELLQSVASQLAIALTRAQLFDHVRQQADRLALLHSMTAVIRSSLDPDTLFHAITQEIGEAFQADICTLSLWRANEPYLQPVGIYAPRLTSEAIETLMPGLTLLMRQSDSDVERTFIELLAPVTTEIPEQTKLRLQVGTKLLLQTRTPIILSDALIQISDGTGEWSLDPSDLNRLDLDPVIEGVLLVPLLQGDDLIGCVSLKRLQPVQAWEADDLKLAEAVAEQAAVAISQAQLLTRTQQLLKQTRQQADQASLLNRMTDRIRHSLNLDTILQSAVEEVGQALGASRVLFLFVNPEEPTATVRHAFTSSDEPTWVGKEIPLNNNPIAPGLAEQTDPIVINTWTDLSEFDLATQARLRQSRIYALMLARLYLGWGHYGILSVHQCGVLGSLSPTSYAWSQADQDLLKLVAEQLVIAINQSHLYEKTQQQVSREALLNEITTQIRISLDPGQVLESIVQALASTLQLDRCEIVLYRSTQSSSRQPSIMIWSDGTSVGRALTSQPWPSIGLPSTQSLRVHESSCQDTDQHEAYWMRTEVVQTLSTGQSVVISAAQIGEDPYIAGEWSDYFQSGSIQSLALIPIIQSQNLIGTIAMIVLQESETDGDSRSFQPDDLSLAMAVAEQAGIAIQQAQLYEQTRISAQRENLLRQLAQRLSSTYDPTQIVEIALESMANALAVDRCNFISLEGTADSTLTQEQEHLAIGTDLELGDEPAIPGDGLVIQQEFRRNTQSLSSIGQALDPDLSWLILLDCYGRHDSLLIEDSQRVLLPVRTRQALLKSAIQSVLCVPLMTDTMTIAGVMCAFVSLPNHTSDPDMTQDPDYQEVRNRSLSSADMELVQALADITAVALQRAKLYEQARRQEATAAAVRGLTEGREAESRRLAADLHDQTLADLGALSRELQNLAIDPSISMAGQAALHQLSNQLRDTIRELRGVVEDLQPTAMRAFNLGPALRSLLERAAQRSALSLVTRFDDRSEGLLNQMDPVSQSTLFRIVQEALNNIVKHAQARRVDITLSPHVDFSSPLSQETTVLEMKIIDDGIGMPEEPRGIGRHGLMNMQYRAELIGAQIEWRARKAGSGTVVHLIVPLSP